MGPVGHLKNLIQLFDVFLENFRIFILNVYSMAQGTGKDSRWYFCPLPPKKFHQITNFCLLSSFGSLNMVYPAYFSFGVYCPSDASTNRHFSGWSQKLKLS